MSSQPTTRRPEATALEELVAAIDCDEAARLDAALAAARDALQLGRVLDGIAADPSIGHGHVGSVG